MNKPQPEYEQKVLVGNTAYVIVNFGLSLSQLTTKGFVALFKRGYLYSQISYPVRHPRSVRHPGERLRTGMSCVPQRRQYLIVPPNPLAEPDAA